MSSSLRHFARPAAIVAGILGSLSVAPTSHAADKATIRIGADYDSLDPVKTVTSDGYQLVNVLYDRLVALDEKGTPVPALAESWSGDASRTVFKLRKGVTCSDGTALTATAAAAALTRLGAKETNAPMAYRTVGIAGYSAVGDDAAGTVTLTMTAPFSDLLIGLAMPWASIVCPSGLKDTEALGSTPSGTGPYTLDKAASVRGSHYVLKLRPDHAWDSSGATGKDPGRPATIQVRVINNNTTAANELQSGTIDVSLVTGRDINRLKAAKSLDFLDAKPFGMQFMMFQHRDGYPTADVLVRRAIATAINRDLATRAATAGNGLTATSYISPLVACYEPKTADLLPKPDAEAAKALLKQAGYAPGSDGIFAKDGKKLRLRLIGQPGLQGSAPEYILEALRAIGVEVELRNITLQETASVMSGPDWEIGVFPFGPPMPSANTVVPFVSGKGSNHGTIENARFAAAQAAALASSPDSPERCARWSEAQLALLEDMNILPLFGGVNTFFSRKGVRFTIGGPFVMDIRSIRVGK